MKVQINKYRRCVNVFLTLFICFIIIGAELLIIFLLENNYNSEENLMWINGNVTEIVLDEEDDKLLFKLDTQNHTFSAFLKRDEVKDLYKIFKIGDNVEILISSKRLKLDVTQIIKLNLNGEKAVDLEDYYSKVNKTILIISIVFISLSIISFIMFIKTKNNNKVKEIDYFELILPFCNRNYINNKNLTYKQLENRNFKYTFSYIVFIFILLIGIIVTGNVFPDYPHIIIPIVVILMVVNTFILFKKIVIYRSNDEKIKEFVSIYKKYLDKQIDFGISINCDYLTENGITFITGEDINYDCYNDYTNEERIIPYEDIEFNVVCIYKNNFHYVNIFIYFDVDEDNNPYYFELDPKTYELIKRYNIKVNNLNYLLENLESEIKKNKPKIRYKIVNYNMFNK